jgi:hypothetical protein
MSTMPPCCPCDVLVHPPKPDIPAGLSALPRQLAGFPEYRRALLREIPRHPPLLGWRAREGDDRGVMLLEMWAYVLDILGFYDERITNESYLRTAVLRPSLRRLVELIGYRPRPALAAKVVLAAIAEEPRPLLLPAGTGFRSAAFNGEPPQVFESSVDTLIEPKRNQWTLRPVRDTFLGEQILLEPASARIAEGQLVLLLSRAARGIPGRVVGKETITALDGASYVRLRVGWTRRPDPETALSGLELLSPSLNASGVVTTAARTSIRLDAFYPQILEGNPVIVRRGEELHATTVVSTARFTTPIAADGPNTVVTAITVADAVPGRSRARRSSGVVVHFHMVGTGRLTRVARTNLLRDDVDGAVVEPPVRAPETDPPSVLLLHDAEERGRKVGGTVAIDPRDPLGGGVVYLDDDEVEFTRPLRAPLTVYGNLVDATRGESVFNEVLGSGDASRPFQSFTLAKKPLTYLAQAQAQDGRLSTLEMRVNGILWSEVPSFFGAGPRDEIYIVRENDDYESIVTFGDGVSGARLPTGVENVVATYRHGAGAAKPPANSITQLARPTKGLRRVRNPVAAGGGRDADRLQDLRRNAPTSSLTLGRAVSLVDFEALAHDFGVLNAQASWAWDEACQRAVVRLWFISDGGDVAQDLRAYLIGQADPNTPLEVSEAVAVASALVIDLEVAPRFEPRAVEAEVIRILTDPETGLLSLRNVPIGRALFRSRIFERVLSAQGVTSVRGMTLDGRPAPVAIVAEDGRYRDLVSRLRVGGTEAADRVVVEAAEVGA